MQPSTITFIGHHKHLISPKWGAKFYRAVISIGIPARSRYLRRKLRTAAEAHDYGFRFVQRYQRYVYKCQEG
jgi:hypothetical protein